MSEQNAVTLAQAGFEDGFRHLYEMHREMVYRLAYRYVGSSGDAEDIMQETFVKAFRNITKFRYRQTGSFSAWLCRICINSVIGHLRKQKSRRIDRTIPLHDLDNEPAAKCPSPENTAQTGQLLSLIRAAAESLSPHQRIAFDLRYSKHLEIAEIAEMMGSSESSVKTHISRSLARLRKELRPIWE
jgi:RNA polymerase sigma-70 factor (ECF subfamily)